MRVAKLVSAVGTSAVLLCALASAALAQEQDQRAPNIRVYSTNGSYALATTSYVTPVIEVSENAYVFAVSMDADGQIQVLQPDFPGISVKVLAHRQLKLPNFFTGFNRSMENGGYYSQAGNYNRNYGTYNNNFGNDTRGTVIALASRAPFNLDLIQSGGDWNMSTIRRLIDNRSPESAAQALASYLGAKGEPIGRDFFRFAGNQNYNSGYNYASGYSSCDQFGYGYAPTLAARFFQASSAISALRQRGVGASIAYDFCGLPYVIIRNRMGPGVPQGTLPPRAHDTTGIPGSRVAQHKGGRPTPGQSTESSAPLGVFPPSRRPDYPQIGDVTITAPRTRPGVSSQGTNGQQARPGMTSVPAGRVPVERITPRNEPAAATGTMPVRNYSPPPQSARPTPTRAPDAPRAVPSSPPPSSPPPSSPPPREAPPVSNRPTPSR